MQRQYRGQRVDTKEWVYGYLFKIWEQSYILWGTTNGMPNMIEVIPETIGQYTEIKDKNGKEIYEGDIISGKSGVKAEVKWMQEHCAYLAYCTSENKYLYLECGNEQFESVEVIGNIYDNPELLQEVSNE